MKKNEFIEKAIRIGATLEDAYFFEDFYSKDDSTVTIEDNTKYEMLFEKYDGLSHEISHELSELCTEYGNFIEQEKLEKVLTDKDVYYKESVVFPTNTTIPKDLEYVKVHPGISKDFLNEIKKQYPYENVMHIGFGIEKHYGIKIFYKEIWEDYIDPDKIEIPEGYVSPLVKTMSDEILLPNGNKTKKVDMPDF
jgi:hypothetical protein